MPHTRNATERRTEDASLCNNSLIFLLCRGFRKKVSRLPLRARNRRVGFSTADLNFDNFGASHGFVGILYSSRLILLYTNHLEGRQTVENHLVHIVTNSYRCTRNDIINFHLSAFFVVFIFAEAGLSAKIAKNCTQRKFPTIRYQRNADTLGTK